MHKVNDTTPCCSRMPRSAIAEAFYTLPDTHNDAAASAAKAITALTKLGMAEERETGDAAAVSRSDGDLRYGQCQTNQHLVPYVSAGW